MLAPQTGHLPALSVREVIRYACPDASDSAVETAARLAEADEFIRALPDRYDTLIGENGMRLSGGQRQMLGLAQAFLRNPTVLLLDEATSALDLATEERVMKNLLEARRHGTTLIAAHRASMIEQCGRILRLADPEWQNGGVPYRMRVGTSGSAVGGGGAGVSS
jgi:ATP-binding cassette subfamily B protein